MVEKFSLEQIMKYPRVFSTFSRSPNGQSIYMRDSIILGTGDDIFLEI